MPSATISTKGRVTIPIEVRRRLQLKAGDRIEFCLGSEDEVFLTTKRIPFEEIQGILRSRRQKPVSVNEMDKGIKRAVRAGWRRSL